MMITAALIRFVAEYRQIMAHARTGKSTQDRQRSIRALPPEIRSDLGYPDSCTVRMSTRGHQRPCHERW